MKLTNLFVAGATALSLSTSALFAGDIMVKDPYVRSSTPSSKSGAAFFVLMNHTDEDDRLIGARTDVAKRVELHTHIEDENGVMKMTEIEGGIPVAAGEMRHLKRGGDHVMLMGLTEPLEQGAKVTITLTFEKAGDVEVTMPVDRKRRPNHGDGSHNHDS